MSYVIEVNLGIVFLYGLYELVLARENDFRKQRIALLAILLCALMFPLISIETAQQQAAIPTIQLPEIVVGNIETTIDWIKIMYYAMVVLIAIPFVINAIKLLVVFRRSRRYSNFHIVESNSRLPSWSFFNLIYIGRSNEINEEERELIMKHEMLHSRLFHSLDTILIALLCIVFWFNPVLWIMRRTIAKIHEYEVDSIIATQSGVVDYTLLLAKTALSGHGFLLTHHFNQSFILKRINMINMIKSKISIWKFAGLGIAIALYFVAVACSEPGKGNAVEKQASDPSAHTGDVYTVVEENATPKDGMESLMRELGEILMYPTESREAGREGTVFVEFVVNKDGSLSGYKVLKGVDKALDEEALRAVSKLKNWNPARMKGEIVRERLVLPIKFKLD